MDQPLNPRTTRSHLSHRTEIAFPNLTRLNWPAPMNIRLATPADVSVVTDFNLRLADETEQLKLDPPTVRAGVAAVLGDAHKGLYFLAELDGRIAGQLMITYEWSDWRNGDLWWLQSVYVHPDFRSRGVFKALFAHLTELARARRDV